MNEPQPKKRRLVRTGHVQIVLPDSLIKPISYSQSVIGIITEKRKLSNFIKEINKSFPLPRFQHLKRVKNNEIFLFPWSYYCQTPSPEPIGKLMQSEIKDYMVENHFPKGLLDGCEFRVQEVPDIGPQIRRQYEEAVQKWPCKFHENKDLERRVRNDIFSSKEREFHIEMMAMCLRFCEIFNQRHLSLAFDPHTNKIVAFGWTDKGDRLLKTVPKSHSVMRAVDNVAKAQNGGAWNDEKDNEFLKLGLEQLDEEFLGFRELNQGFQGEAVKYGPYLCTGLDLYLTEEPCLMCAMALVHSRAKRIFFGNSNAENGALGGRLKLHGVSELNHHYDVYQIDNKAS